MSTTEHQAAVPGRYGLVKVCAGRVIWANRGFERMLGYASNDLAGRLSRTLVTAGTEHDDFRAATHPDEPCAASPVELHLRSRNGAAVRVEAHLARYDVASDDALWIVVDVTACRQAADTLQTTRAFLDQISSVAGVGGWRYDIASGVVTWSDETCRLHDVLPGHRPSIEEAIGYFVRDGRVAIVEALERATETGAAWDIQVPMRSARGRPFWARAVGMIERRDGQPVCLIGTFQDVTQDRAAAEALRDTLRRLEVLFNSSPDSMTIARAAPDGRFVYEAVNPVWERLTGVAAADALGRSPADVLPIPLAALVSESWEQCLASRDKFGFAFTSTDGGRDRQWEALLTPVLDGGRVDRVLAIARDVTERSEIEAKLQTMQRMDAVGQLTAGIAHDFNNLLHTIMAALDMLRSQDPHTPAFAECARVAHNAAHRGAVLVHRLLAFSHKQPLTPIAVQPGELIGDLEDLLRTAVGRGIRVETRLGTDWSIRADRGQLENCLINLAVNARDAMEGDGLLRLSVDAIGRLEAAAFDAPPGQYIRVTVEDDGPGMPPATLARAAEPFFTTKPVGKGTGLGLSMVQGFARQSGGDFAIRSVPGQGTTVTLWLPRAEPCVSPAAMHRPAMEEVLGR